ncbi:MULTISPECIES: D-alanyl-D-alanine carboxypeptidase family protein [Streptomyces]|uniref:D-alanyl-D-alanine carboxypeptidase n=1 Tax=Streptomyces lycii TaxID=2654337 RepID=A0ABQ7F992_9ACTN|nr:MULTISPECIES: D-alanyl-D-alanine carboxypeptidase [Streptomyces]KAF4405055.1 D-alanyl-D-alanine carboxypeptidase [Streptomyces lycii]PGH47682.1 D-alanyl-D-alanine carboxypeptidase [Streptomyces sp. Ru87]
MDAISGFTLRICAAAVAALCCLTAGAAPPRAHADTGGDGRPGPGAAARPLSAPGLHAPPGAAGQELPSGLSARSWMVSDARTGQVLAAKDAHRRLPPASTLKTLFAVTLLPKFPQDTLRTVSEAELRNVGPGSSRVGIRAGNRYTVADLWLGVFLSSGNDAVHALAAMNGSVERTVRQMQAKARMLGAVDTQVVSPDGYDAPGQVSSAYDLSLIARAGLQNPHFARYSAMARADFPTGRTADGRVTGSFGIQNTNRLLSGGPGVTPYRGLIGVKNGYTSEAGNTLVAAARRDGRTLLVTVMNPRSGVPHAVYEEARSLLDWGFTVAGEASSVGTLNQAGADEPRHGSAALSGAASPGAGSEGFWTTGRTVPVAAAALLAGALWPLLRYRRRLAERTAAAAAPPGGLAAARTRAAAPVEKPGGR